MFPPPSAGDAHGSKTYDVVICGGGLAGATLSRQLRLRHPDVTVLVIDGQRYPVPPAAFKVGESTVDIAGFYFSDVLELGSYMQEKHLPKLGLRYFFGSPDRPFWEAPELGLSLFAPCPTYQIDRGVLENDLYEMNCAAGVDIATGSKVLDIDLRNGTAPHIVTYRDGGDVDRRVRCRWVVDAMGRVRYLQRKLGLARDTDGVFNAVWFRVKGRLDIEDFVPEEQRAWHARVPGRQRYYSTNHLMGQGYWVWMIPLGSGNTSVGIVTSAEFHDIGEMDSIERAMAWLERHEPAVSALAVRHEVMDFLAAHDFSYTSTHVFSADRWGCVGEAAAFADPFYSPGSNMIAFENSALVALVGEDARGELRPARVEALSAFALGQNDWVEYNIHSSYSYFGEPLIMALSFIWDTLLAWTTATPQMFNGIFVDDRRAQAVRSVTGDLYALVLRVKGLFKQWEGMSRRGRRFTFIDYYAIPFLKGAYDRNLVKGKTTDELVDDHRATMRLLDEVAQAIFLLAVDDTMPGQRARLGERPWVNAWAIGLDPHRWTDDGLFDPPTPPRDLTHVLAQLDGLFEPPESDRVDGAPRISLDLDV